VVRQQGNAFDKIFKENFTNLRESSFGLIRKLLGPAAVEAISLPGDMQRTLELKADNFFLVTAVTDERFILQMEWQSYNDTKMVSRMLLYHALCYDIYKLPVRGIVIYVGQKEMNMVDYVSHYGLDFGYELINLMDMDAEEFLSSSAPEEILLAVLAGRTRNKEKRSVIRKVIFKLQQLLQENPVELKRRLLQLEILGDLRNVQKIIVEEEHNMAIEYNLERDIRYRQGKSVGFFKGKERGLNEGKELGISEGINQGIVQAKTAIVKNLLKEKKYTHAEIAAIAEVSVDFVQTIQKNQQ
jgi:predicted transposase/invertase (TIGR01784 family)